jgi:hypothetical protein
MIQIGPSGAGMSRPMKAEMQVLPTRGVSVSCRTQAGPLGRNNAPAGVEDVILALEHVVLAAKLERELGQVRDRLARDRVLAVPALGRAELLVEHLGNVGRERDERGARVDGRARVLELERLVAEGDALELDLPANV